MIRKSIETYHSKYAQTFRCWLPSGSQLLELLRLWSAFVSDMFFDPLGGTPLDRCWHPLRHFWSEFLDLLEEFRSEFAPNVKDSRAINGTNHTFKKARKDSNNFYR